MAGNAWFAAKTDSVSCFGIPDCQMWTQAEPILV